MNETDRKLYDEITDKYKQLAQIRKPWESTWKEISRFVNPKRNDWDIDKSMNDFNAVFDKLFVVCINRSIFINGYICVRPYV